MKATDLMIGDWVSVYIEDDDPAQCGYVTCKVENINDFGDIGAKCNDYREEDVEPIPLTPEILAKNGFVYGYKQVDYEQVDYRQRYITYYHIGLDFYLDLYGGEILLKIRQDCDFTFFGIISCKYVHELQHALKLCGIEKEIVL